MKSFNISHVKYTARYTIGTGCVNTNDLYTCTNNVTLPLIDLYISINHYPERLPYPFAQQRFQTHRSVLTDLQNTHNTFLTLYIVTDKDS